MIPSIGRIVHITLSDECASYINTRRLTSGNIHGNPVSGGEVFPMMITKIWADEPTENTAVQGQIFLDGDDTYWVTSAIQGTDKGQWFEPPRV